jgi:simple sugar transport system permease protein
MGTTQEAASRPGAEADERLRRVNPLRRLLVRPEMGAVAGSIAVWLFFALVAGSRGFLSLSGTSTYLSVAAELGILAVTVALLMIGGEFDLSIGSILGGCSMIVAILPAQFGWNIWAAIAVAFLFAFVVGFLNGYLVLRTGLPSFIITLASQFVIRGTTIGVTRILTGRTQVGGLDAAPGFVSTKAIFASDIPVADTTFPITIVWWLALAALATWMLLRTSFGNWIFGVGGDPQAARNVGVPVSRVKITLFVLTAFSGCLLGVMQTVRFTGADVLRGQGDEFLAIIAVVVGGTLLTGGYGSAIGTVFGALIFGMVRQGIVFAGIDADWYEVFLGVMLLIAVLLNQYVRSRAMEAKR